MIADPDDAKPDEWLDDAPLKARHVRCGEERRKEEGERREEVGLRRSI